MQESVPMEVNHSNVAAQREESANMSDNIADGFVMKLFPRQSIYKSRSLELLPIPSLRD